MSCSTAGRRCDWLCQRDTVLKKTCIIAGICHRYHFCHDKHAFVAINTRLSRQNTSFVATKECLSRPNLCRDVIMFTKQVFVATNVLSRQEYFRHDKRRVSFSRQKFCPTKICRDKRRVLSRKHIFVATNTNRLSRQK